jgi:hypothetical protein
LVVDSGKNCVAHDTIYAILAALFCLVHFAFCNYFAIYGFESPVKLSIHCISNFKYCGYITLSALSSEVLCIFSLNQVFCCDLIMFKAKIFKLQQRALVFSV